MAAPLPKSMLNTVKIGDETYKLTVAYTRGAWAFREDKSSSDNPYDVHNQADSYDDWNFGFENEAQGEHFRFDQDVLRMPKEAVLIDIDPDVPRTRKGAVKPAWLKPARRRYAVKSSPQLF